MSLESDKRAAQEQWTAEPAGAHLAEAHERGTPEFFSEVERTRYEFYPWLLEFLQSSRWQGKRVIEVGVGLGTDHLQLRRAGADLVGVDLTEASVEHTRRRFELLDEKTELHVADAEALPFPDASFDAAYSFGVLHHTPGMASGIRELHRLLRPGGTAVVALYNRHSYFYAWRLLRHYVRGDWRRKSLSDMRADFEHGEGAPLVIVSSRRELLDLFSGFSAVKVSARHLPTGRLPARLRPALRRALAPLERRIGWYWIVEATR